MKAPARYIPKMPKVKKTLCRGWERFLAWGCNRDTIWNMDQNDEIRDRLKADVNVLLSDQFEDRWTDLFEQGFRCPWAMRDLYQYFERTWDLGSDDKERYSLLSELLGDLRDDDGMWLDFAFLQPEDFGAEPDYSEEDEELVEAIWGKGGFKAESLSCAERTLKADLNRLEKQEKESGEAAATWLKTFLCQTTRRTHRQRLGQCAKITGRRDVADFSRDFIADPEGMALTVRDIWADAGREPSYFRGHLSTLKTFAGYLARKGTISGVPKIEIPSVETRWTDNESAASTQDMGRVEDWIETLPEPGRTLHRALFRCLYHQALRRAEVASIRLCDVRDRELWIVAKGKKGQRCPVPLAGHTREALCGLRDALAKAFTGLESDSPLFVAPKALQHGGTVPERIGLATINRLVEVWEQAVGMNLHPHMMRHAAITGAIEDGAAPFQVAALSRHSVGYVTQRYYDRPGTAALEIMEKLARRGQAA